MDTSQPTILITGIGGFIGYRTAELALARGMKVRGLQHSPNKANKAKKLGAEVIVGSITNPADAEKACQGVDIVLHTAAIAKESGSLKHFHQVNVTGSLNMAKAAKKAGVKCFVHLSTVMVYGFNYPDKVTEESQLFKGNNPYCQTKILAETELLKLNQPPDFGIIIIRPGDVYGPGSIPWVIRPLLLMQKRLFIYANNGQGVMNHLYVDNLIESIFLSIEKQVSGEIFNITDGEETSWKEYFSYLAEIAGFPAPFSLPADVLKLLLKLRCFGQTALGKPVDALPDSIDFITRPHAYSIAKAQTKLGYQPKIDLKEGMRRTQEWLEKTDIQKFLV